MASPLTRTRLDAALKKWFPNGGYEFRSAIGRPGTFDPDGFVVHHTGGPYTDSDSYLDFLFKIGRPAEGIPAQLCQFAVGASGKLYIGDFDSRANHAGMGDDDTLSKVRNQSHPGFTSEINPGADSINGNPEYYGVEVMYPGTLPMKVAQYATTVRLAAMIVDTYGWSALRIVAHREHSERKWDPGQHSLVKFRNDVKALLAAGSTTDWLSMATLAEVKTAVREVLAEKVITLHWDGGPPNAAKVSIFEALSFIHFNAADGSFAGQDADAIIPLTSSRVSEQGRPTFAARLIKEVDGIEEKLAQHIPNGEGDPTP